MSRLKILTSFNIELDFEIPDFHKRLFAWLLDIVVALILLFTMLKFFKADGWRFLIIMLPISLYPVVTEVTMNGQTIGKKILGIKK